MRAREAMIGAVVVAWVVVGSLVFVLPAVAWWVGSREHWNRVGRRAEPDPYREVVRRHSLRPAEAAEVEGAVTWGRELQDPRLRAAVVDWVESARVVSDPDRRPRPRWQRLLALALLCTVVLVAGALVHTLAGREGVVLLGTVLVLGEMVDRLVGQGPVRALRRNSGPPPT